MYIHGSLSLIYNFSQSHTGTKEEMTRLEQLFFEEKFHPVEDGENQWWICWQYPWRRNQRNEKHKVHTQLLRISINVSTQNILFC